MRGRKHYSNDDLNQEIDEYCNGTKLKIACDHLTHTPRRTITRGELGKRQNISKKRPGPDHVLSSQIESDLVDWVIGIKSKVYPLT